MRNSMSETRLGSEFDSLKRDSQRFAALVEICPNGIAVCSGDRIIAANPALGRLIGTSDSAGIVGRELQSLLSPETQLDTTRKLREMLVASLGHTATCMAELQRVDGSIVNVEASIDHLESNGASDFVVVFRQLAVFRCGEVMNREDYLQQAYLHRMAVFGELAASLVHELGQPLTAAKGAAEILHQQLTDGRLLSDGERSAAITMSAVNTAASKFHRIWNFVRTHKPCLEQIGVNSVVENAVDIVGASSRHAGIEIHFQPGQVTFFNVDLALTELVLTSLLRRSVTSLVSVQDRNRIIRVETSQPNESHIEISIEHNGEAMTAEEEGHSVLEHEDLSSHLSLSICRTIIYQNGGVLGIEPVTDRQGVRYRIIFPV